jgi:MFS family permease
LSLYLQYIKGLSAEQAGIILVAQPAILAILSPVAGRLSDRFEPRIVASGGMALVFLGLLLFSFLSPDSSIVQIVILLLVVGLGMSLFIPPNTNTVMGSVTPKYYGIASAANGTMRALGQMLRIGITAVIIAIIVGMVVITPVHYPAFLTSARVSFGVFSALCFIGIFTSLARGKIR